MDITINIEDDKINVSNEGSINADYSWGVEVNLTDLVEKLSESDKKITIIPENYEDLIDREKHKEDTIKLLEYIYNIINAFNESYQQVIEETA